IMHVFDISTEAGTRDTLNGNWFQNYIQSVSELRGWSDSDTFMAPYVGHPLEGSIFGYIFRQNDPRYHDVQWGDGRDYFISVLRSLAWSAAWHTQWKIGPISEASIGNVIASRFSRLHHSGRNSHPRRRRNDGRGRHRSLPHHESREPHQQSRHHHFGPQL